MSGLGDEIVASGPFSAGQRVPLGLKWPTARALNALRDELLVLRARPATVYALVIDEYDDFGVHPGIAELFASRDQAECAAAGLVGKCRNPHTTVRLLADEITVEEWRIR